MDAAALGLGSPSPVFLANRPWPASWLWPPERGNAAGPGGGTGRSGSLRPAAWREAPASGVLARHRPQGWLQQGSRRANPDLLVPGQEMKGLAVLGHGRPIAACVHSCRGPSLSCKAWLPVTHLLLGQCNPHNTRVHRTFQLSSGAWLTTGSLPSVQALD